MGVQSSTDVQHILILSTIAININVIIHRAVGAPGHGNDVGGGLNEVRNQYIYIYINNVSGCSYRIITYRKII